jgi:hypothetical protein
MLELKADFHPLCKGRTGVKTKVVNIEVRNLIKRFIDVTSCNMQLEDGGNLQPIGLNNEH